MSPYHCLHIEFYEAVSRVAERIAERIAFERNFCCERGTPMLGSQKSIMAERMTLGTGVRHIQQVATRHGCDYLQRGAGEVHLRKLFV